MARVEPLEERVVDAASAQAGAPTLTRRMWWAGVWHIAARDLRDQARDWRIITPIFGLTLVFPLLANFTARRMVEFMNRYGAELLTERLFPFLMLAVGFFPLSISLVVALESFAGERERGTIEPLLATPLDDAQLYLGKLLAVLVLPLSASWVGLGAYLLTLGLRLGWWPPLPLLGTLVLLNLVQAVVMVCGAVLVSAQATSVRSANLLASVIILPVAFLLMFESLLMFYQRYRVLTLLAAALSVLAVILVRLGLAHFNREALLSREWDRLDWRALGRYLKAGWRGTATDWRTWWWETWRLAWREQAGGNGLALLLLVAAVGLGAVLGASYASEVPEAIRQGVGDAWVGSLPAAGWAASPLAALRSPLGALAIFLHNLRALLIILAVGAVSLGLGGALLVALPLGVLGAAMEVAARWGLMSRLTFWLALVLPHGVAEIPAMLCFGGALLHWGVYLITPNPEQGIGTAWLYGLGRTLRILVGVVLPCFALAALLEAFLTPWVAWLALR